MNSCDGRLARDVRMFGAKPRPLSDYSTANFNDAMERIGLSGRVLEPAIRPLLPFTKMIGIAVTMKLELSDEPGRYAEFYSRAMEAGKQIDSPILVIESPRDAYFGTMGSGGAHILKNHYGFVGCLLEGAVRDTDDLRNMNFQVYSRSISPRHVFGIIKGVSINEAVVVGGVKINSGDFIIADNDGVVAIPQGDLVRVTEAVNEDLRMEGDLLREIDDGKGSYLEVVKKYQPNA